MKNVFEKLDNSNVVSIVGICKNAGKTTVLNYLLSHYSNCVNAISSIGRDGESQDIVTFTEKPSIYVKRGTLIATAEHLLPLCTVTMEILQTTDYNTPLGQVVIIRALSDGYVQIAGPSQVAQMLEVKDSLVKLGAERVFIDGAISRLSPCTPMLSQATILVAGAGYDANIEAVIEHTTYLTTLLSLDRAKDEVISLIKSSVVNSQSNEQCTCITQEDTAIECNIEQAMSECADNLPYIYIKGALTNQIVVSAIKSASNQRGKTIIVDDSSKIVLDYSNYYYLSKRGIAIKVNNSINLALICTNPVSPYGYRFDAQKLREGIASACANIANCAVIDVKQYIDEVAK